MKFKLTVIILCVLLAVSVFAGCGTAPSISEAKMTTAVDSNANATDEVTSYNTNASQFVVAAKLNDAQKDTYVTFIWRFEQEKIYEYELDAGAIQTFMRH
jgi:uncharacterized protein YpmB